MKFGKFECNAVETDMFYLDGGAMFGVVPKVLWQKKIPADSDNRIPMSARVLLIRGESRNILVDTGMGNKLSYKERKIYGLEDVTDIDTRLSKFGITADDITDVIITHLHFDHAGGATKFEEDSLVPAFKNAEYHIQKKHMEYALNPTPRDRASFIKDNIEPLIEHKKVKYLDGEKELFDGIDILISEGHTSYQQHPLVKGDKNSLFFCGDLFPTSAHIPVNWHMGYDNNPLTILEEKRKILERAVDENWIMFFEHDPSISCATLKRGKKGIEPDKIVEI